LAGSFNEGRLLGLYLGRYSLSFDFNPLEKGSSQSCDILELFG
jgi:hypothetical protein